MTVVLLTCSYRDKEFVRVGYYVNNEYTEEEMKENPPARPVIEKVTYAFTILKLKNVQWLFS